MSQSSAFRSDPEALAAAMSRHPASGARGTTSAPADVPLFATVAALLTGPWRVNDPVAFAAAMRSAPLVAGYAVNLSTRFQGAKASGSGVPGSSSRPSKARANAVAPVTVLKVTRKTRISATQ